MRQRRPFARSVLAASIGIFALILGSELIWLLVRRHEDRLRLATGSACWIWATRDLPEAAPLRFMAKKEFTLPGPASPARARIFVDRAYVLRVNGILVGSGSQKPGDALEVYELSGKLNPGPNEISIEASSPTGAGGILFSLDLANGRAIVSDGSWKTEAGRRVAVWGRPPMYPWGYPALREVQGSNFKAQS